MSEVLLISREGSIATLTLNRPDRLNAFNFDLSGALAKAIRKIAYDASIRAVVIQGAGPAFSAGGDIRIFQEKIKTADKVLLQVSRDLHAAILTIMKMPKPVIASVHGSVAGVSYGLMLACDFVIAARGTKITTGFANLGLAPNGGATYLLPRLVGWRRAAELLMTARTLSADEALEWGLVNQVVAPEARITETRALVEQLLKKAPRTIAETKRLMNLALRPALKTHLALERRAIAASSLTPDFAARVDAFLKKV